MASLSSSVTVESVSWSTSSFSTAGESTLMVELAAAVRGEAAGMRSSTLKVDALSTASSSLLVVPVGRRTYF